MQVVESADSQMLVAWIKVFGSYREMFVRDA
jgi:hypothetical protein